MSFSSTPAIFMAFSSTWVAEATTSPEGVQSFPMILLFSMMTAFVVEEPESSPAVMPVCLSLARSSFLVTMVTRASILVSSWDALSLSVKEYVTTGSLVCSWMNLLSSFLTRAASAHLKHVVMNTASASYFSSASCTALAIISLSCGDLGENPNLRTASSMSAADTSGYTTLAPTDLAAFSISYCTLLYSVPQESCAILMVISIPPGTLSSGPRSPPPARRPPGRRRGARGSRAF